MKDFDIFLNKRLTECDVIVYSIPYRDGLTIMNRLILESCIESYTLQKFVAVQFGSELVSHIDEMIKTCYERLNFGVELGVSAEFKKYYLVSPKPIGIEIGQEKIKLLSRSFTDAENAMQIAAAPLLAQISKSAGHGESVVEIEQSVKDTLKTSIEQFASSIQMCSSVYGMAKRGYDSFDNGVMIGADLTDLYYRFYEAAEVPVLIAAEVLATELHYSMGHGESSIVIDAEVADGDYATKYETVSNIVSILADAIESITQFMFPSENKMQVLSEAELIKRRYRRLYELDPDELLSYDSMELEDVDYVIL